MQLIFARKERERIFQLISVSVADGNSTVDGSHCWSLVSVTCGYCWRSESLGAHEENQMMATAVSMGISNWPFDIWSG